MPGGGGLRADIIHAHSPSLNGIPALNAARKCIPVVYEVRALETRRRPAPSEKSIKYRVSKFMETRPLRLTLFTICDGRKISF
jgi:hypothetical protein